MALVYWIDEISWLKRLIIKWPSSPKQKWYVGDDWEEDLWKLTEFKRLGMQIIFLTVRALFHSGEKRIKNKQMFKERVGYESLAIGLYWGIFGIDSCLFKWLHLGPPTGRSFLKQPHISPKETYLLYLQKEIWRWDIITDTTYKIYN